MAKRIVIQTETPVSALSPALSIENREQQIGNAAMNLAEKQILEGTASSQVITYFLKTVSSKEKLEVERLREENKKLRAQTEALQSAKRMEEMYSEAMQAFRGYRGDDAMNQEGEYE